MHWMHGARTDGSASALQQTRFRGNAQRDDTRKMVYLGLPGSQGQGHNVRRTAQEQGATRARADTQTSSHIQSSACGLPEPKWTGISCSIRPSTRVVDVRSSTTPFCDRIRVDCGQRAGHANTTRHDMEHMAQIWGSGQRTCQTTLEIMARL